jgi:hypothetical protein
MTLEAINRLEAKARAIPEVTAGQLRHRRLTTDIFAAAAR